MPVPNDDDDDNDSTPKGLQRRLKRVADLLETANTRLERIRGGLSEPPTPDRPALINVLTQVKTQASEAATKAESMTARLRR